MFKGENEFSVGDRVKFKKSSLETGMIDAKEDDVFIIEHFQDKAKTLALLEGKYFAIYNVEHLEHVKEQTMNNTEGQEIKWEFGQEVWDTIFGDGEVVDYDEEGYSEYPVKVRFKDDSIENYTKEGKIFKDCKRSLFFSEPTVTAELFPPKKPFVPTLKKGDVLVIKWVGTTQLVVVEQETEHQVKGICGLVWDKDPDVHFYKCGEEIKFN